MTLVAIAALAVAVAPEVGRMIDFASFETFDPEGPGLGNLFNPISPLEALGIWPSGDFRLDPGDGAMPAAGFYLGEALGLAALAYGLAWWLGRGERAVPPRSRRRSILFAYAHFAGTPYQAAKAIVIASPLAMLIAARALLSPEPLVELGGLRGAIARRRAGFTGILARRQRPLRLGLAVAFLGAAAASSVAGPRQRAGGAGDLLARAHGAAARPRQGLDRGPGLTAHARRGARSRLPRLGASRRPGLRGGRGVALAGAAPTRRFTRDHPGLARSAPPFADLRLARRAGPYVLWRTRPAPSGHGTCPLISVGGRADPDA